MESILQEYIQRQSSCPLDPECLNIFKRHLHISTETEVHFVRDMCVKLGVHLKQRRPLLAHSTKSFKPTPMPVLHVPEYVPGWEGLGPLPAPHLLHFTPLVISPFLELDLSKSQRMCAKANIVLERVRQNQHIRASLGQHGESAVVHTALSTSSSPSSCKRAIVCLDRSGKKSRALRLQLEQLLSVEVWIYYCLDKRKTRFYAGVPHLPLVWREDNWEELVETESILTQCVFETSATMSDEELDAKTCRPGDKVRWSARTVLTSSRVLTQDPLASLDDV